MRRVRSALGKAVGTVLVAGTVVGCATSDRGGDAADPPSASPTESKPEPGSEPVREPDPRWRFYTDDPRRYASPWFAGRHRAGRPGTVVPRHAPDGCHLHLEVRPTGGSYLAAVDPARWLGGR